MEIKLQKIGVFYNPKKREAKKGIDILKDWAERRGIEVIPEGSNVDLGVAIGGDGTVLYTLQKLSIYNIPVVGINTGRLGFLTTVEFKDIDVLLDSIEKGNFFIEKHPVIKLTIDQNVFYAFNEVVFLKSENTPLISINFIFNNGSILTPPADGVIVATSAGSTAYALSAGGAIIFPELEVTEVIPICAHSLSSRPLVLDLNNINIQVKFQRKSTQVEIWIDGKEIDIVSNKNEITISKADFYGRLIFLPGWDFVNRLKKKLHWR
ncbi:MULTISPECIES: NAD(+)/NADH kinase [Dictyoglomus]|uniref:NAD kinase n=1 Tax=Dictyoglomus turgidum (strain DSM 6724 / Z-1310) TaxID=515635 RepID=B8E249_DICTD|nr:MULTISPECIES: NAD(+)/NADH kinase [Dictyoglomus]ACK42326.1 ATP-NAD/AcoX kinase [Dictyoglomus turgidum DSM 6724]HBU32219.1 NAD(+)/NADH kinase [Dictyoglomus sp.]